MIKSFRGMILDGGQERIRLSTNNGLIGYRILKFQVMPSVTGSGTNEALVTIWNYKQAAAIQDINFNDPNLLGAAMFLRDQGVVAITSESIIFDSAVFNQDIFVTYADAQGSTGLMNYYIELEQVRLDLNESTVATLKDMRGRE